MKIFWPSATLLLAVITLTSCVSTKMQKSTEGVQHPSSALPGSTAQRARLADYIKTHYQSPTEYILHKFVDHDIVFLGEWHRIKHDPVLVQSLIPALYANGMDVPEREA